MVEWERQLEGFNSLLEDIAQRSRNGEGGFRFGRPFITASDIARQYFCEKKVEMAYIHGEVETESKTLGAEAHEKLLEGSVRIRRRELWQRIYGRKPVVSQETLLVARYKDVILAGMPDSIFFFRGAALFLFEYKFGRSRWPFRDHHVQARTYGILLRDMGFDMSKLFYAIVIADPEARNDRTLRSRVVDAATRNEERKDVLPVRNARIFLNRFDEVEAERDLDWAICFWKNEREAIPTRNPNKCRSCEYNAQCESYRSMVGSI